jgi:hypothetical protein
MIDNEADVWHFLQLHQILRESLYLLVFMTGFTTMDYDFFRAVFTTSPELAGGACGDLLRCRLSLACDSETIVAR